MQNPFFYITRATAVAQGEAFIGRKRAQAYLLDKILQSEPRHLSIHGLPHIGKSSLLRKLEQTLISEAGLPCCVVYRSLLTRGFAGDMGFLIRRCFPKALENCEDETLQTLLETMRGVSLHAEAQTLLSLFRQLLERTTQLGIRVVMLLDEFERISGTKDDSETSDGIIGWSEEEYLGFAEILLDRSLNFVCVTASRPRMEENLSKYELKINPFISYLLRGFNEQDMEAYFETLQRCGLEPLDESDMQKLLRLCGRSPLLLTLMGNALLSKDDNTTLEQLYPTLQQDFYKHFEDITDFMKAEEKKKKRNFSHIVKCYFGASVDYRDILERCIALGYIDIIEAEGPYTFHGGSFYYTDTDGLWGDSGKKYVYITLSHLFVDYLYARELDHILDTRDLLTGFIYTLRDITKKEFSARFADWNEKLLFMLSGRDGKFIMKHSDGRFVLWEQQNGKWQTTARGIGHTLYAEAQTYALTGRRGQLIEEISDSSLFYLVNEFNSDCTYKDMPLLDVINLTENGRIMLRYANIFKGYFGCFGSSFDPTAQNQFLQCLESLRLRRNKISHFSRTGMSEEESRYTASMCRYLLKSIYTYLSDGHPMAPTEAPAEPIGTSKR